VRRQDVRLDLAVGRGAVPVGRVLAVVAGPRAAVSAGRGRAGVAGLSGPVAVARCVAALAVRDERTAEPVAGCRAPVPLGCRTCGAALLVRTRRAAGAVFSVGGWGTAGVTARCRVAVPVMGRWAATPVTRGIRCLLFRSARRPPGCAVGSGDERRSPAARAVRSGFGIVCFAFGGVGSGHP